MIAATLEGAPPRWIRNKQIKKTSACRASERLEAEYHRIDYDFHGSGMNPISSYPFLQSSYLLILISGYFLNVLIKSLL